ncbi:MAG TPA: TRL-like family protein [Planctomycetota bacterium]|nr:TRL-like family protein [Planctomycetota bacterium]
MFKVLAVLSLCFIAYGCSVPRSPIAGALYTNVKDVLIANPGPVPASLKPPGEAMATGIFGITTGDSSIETAMKNGGITKIHFVDYSSWGIMGIYGTTTTRVYGE